MINHQKTARFCIDLQNKDEYKYFECVHCEKKFTSHYRQLEHACEKNKKKKDDLLAMTQKRKDEDNKIIKECEERLQQKYQEIVKDKNETIAKLEAMVASLQKTISEIALQPKTTNNNHNSNNSSNVTINNRFDIYNTKQIGDVLQKYLTKDVVARGQEGVAIMIGEYLLKGPNGEPLYECTDVARQKFEFINVDGNVETDPKATKLIRSINKSGLCAQTKTASDDLWTNTDGRMDHDKYEVYAGKVTEIMMLENDSTKLRNKLASVTARQKGKKQ
jgi:uncharacterized protein YukE